MGTRLENAREALVGARDRFEEKKKQEWEALSARLQVEVEDAVVEARKRGETITQIGKQYGTKDRATIYRILNKRQAQNALVVESGGAPVITRDGDVYTFTVGREKFQFEWDFDTHAALMFVGDFDNTSEVFKELRKPNNAYASLIEDGEI